MACVTGTNIVNDGLVFHFDLENSVKSWKGKPTSNLSVGKFFNGNGNFTTNETIQDELPDGSIGDVRYLNADYVYDPNRTVSIGNYSLTAGETYTLSFYVKNIDCTGFGGNLYSPGLSRVIGSIIYPTIYTDRWTRVITTFTVPDEGVNPVSVSPQAFRDGGNGFFKMCWLQMEQGDVATKYINGIRLSTASIIDVSPTQSTITVANLTYVQDDTPTFDGTNDYISIPQPNVSLSPNNWTIEGWIKSGNQTSFFITPNSNGIDNFLRYDASQQQLAMTVCSAADTNGRGFGTGVGSVPYDTWTHFSVSIDNLDVKMHINGELKYSGTETISMSGWAGIWRIGQRGNGTYYLLGELDNLKIYNRALTAQEVKQNFEATRSRYGI